MHVCKPDTASDTHTDFFFGQVGRKKELSYLRESAVKKNGIEHTETQDKLNKLEKPKKT